MIIDSVLLKEKERNRMMLEEYGNILSSLPKGSIIKKNGGYFYLKYRENGKVIDKYIGKDDEKIKELSYKIEQRKHIEKMIVELKNEEKRISKMMGVNK